MTKVLFIQGFDTHILLHQIIDQIFTQSKESDDHTEGLQQEMFIWIHLPHLELLIPSESRENPALTTD